MTKSNTTRAIFFDFNGVIVDDEPVHMAMFQKVLAEEGLAMTKAQYYKTYLGMNDEDCFRAVYAKARRPLASAHLKGLIRRKGRHYNATIAKHLVFFPGARPFVRRMAKRYPLAIVSGALRGEIGYILRRAGLGRCFRVIVAAEDVRRGKPHPDGFLKALRLLNKKTGLKLKPRECLAIEDSKDGVAAAKRAGMHCIAVTTSYPASMLGDADAVFRTIPAISRQGAF